MSVLASSTKRVAVAAVAVAAVLLPVAAAAQGVEIPKEGWEYSAAWDFVQDEYTAEFQADVEEALAKHLPDWGGEAGLEGSRLQNYYIDGVNETPVQRKFKSDFWGDSGNDGLEAAIYLPGGITPGVQDVTGGEEFDGHYLLHCSAGDTACESSETEDGDVVAYTTDGTYVEAAVFHADGSVSWAWFGAFEGATDVTPGQLVGFVLDLDTEPVWHALEND